MVIDPYKVLGVPSTATDDEVKKAYRKLAKIYHPDANPGDKRAEQKMKEINEAYDMIVNSKASGAGPGRNQYGNPYGGFGGFGGYSQGNTAEEAPYMQAARNYINSGRFREALNVLGSINERTARWYYYSAYANAGLGNRIAAQQHAQQAVNMEPGNMEYRMLLERLNSPWQTYTETSRTYGRPFIRPNALCWGLCLANALCRYCGSGYCC